MKVRHFLLSILFLAAAGSALAQGGSVTYTLGATTTGTTLNMPNEGLYVEDDGQGGGARMYSNNVDYYITITGVCTAPNYLALTFNDFDIDPSDTVYIYDGPNTSSPLIVKANNNLNNLLFQTVYISLANTTNSITLRYKTDGSGQGLGFYALATCDYPCERATPYIDSLFVKTKVIDGVRQPYDTCKVVKVPVYDTISWYINNGDTVYVLDTNYFNGVNLCVGDGVIFTAHCDYTSLTGHYNPTDATTMFKWNFGNTDTLWQVGATEVSCDRYFDLDCYEVTLNVTDVRGCEASTFATVTVRLAQNPIKTIYDLDATCTVDSTPLTVGYDGEGTSSLTLRRISFEKMQSKTNMVRTFIPDGPNCPIQCYSAPVEFREFPNGRKVQSKDDICSVCVNYEHEFMGDYELSIVCPSGNKARLKYKNAPAGYPTGAGAGSGTFTGYPYGGNGHHTWDGSPICDSLPNPYGEGLDYCFSRNGSYTLVDGQLANTINGGQYYLGNTGIYIDNVTYDFNTIPAGFTGSPAGSCSFSTKHPSDHENKLDYYMPADDFASLVGCPLNGTWEIEVCDTWGSDNGWVFSWSLDICGISSGSGCEYQVGIDSITWLPDSSLADWDLGYYRGLHLDKISPTTAYVLSPDTAGHFRTLVTIYDEFGCVWDTATNIEIIWTPEPNLGPDTMLCDVDHTYFDAKDRHAATENYTYLWSPNGQTTDTIHSITGTGNSAIYTVQVVNEKFHHTCPARDSVKVIVGAQPVPSFDPGVYPLEGCEPFTINVTNYSTNAHKHHWYFGDGEESTEAAPRHTYGQGSYGFKYYVTSVDGCRDSLIYDSLITVFPTPRAAFSWDPVYPTVMNPVINLENHTVPMIDENLYFWEIQYDKDAPYSVHTLTDVNPSFQWESDGEDISGTYIVRLIARTDNLGPSGNINQCRDTVENTILLVNDFLQFPTVVTANGDGVNDRFVIVNLVNGLGYPVNCLDIYNKWGARVFHKENISRDEDFWDPAKDNIPSGTYFYRFSGRGFNGNIERNGCVEVLR